MVHVFVLHEARPLFWKQFLYDMEHKMYPWTDDKGQIRETQVQPRELHLIDYVVKQPCVPYLLNDLAPFLDQNSEIKGRVFWVGKQVAKMFGLKQLDTVPTPTNAARNHWVNSLLLGYKEDQFLGDRELT